MGKEPSTFFEDKIQDPLLLANMKRTADVDTEVILFNIDSKSSIDGKSKDDAILKVFMKVFYEHRGYFGDIPGVAEMEKYLDQKGVYEAFKAEFKALAGEDWVDRRNTFYFDADYVIGALTKVTDMTEESARNWFENGVNNFEISIEKFAKDVKEYVDSKGNNFHLVFLVDEIGQYIGDSRQLMLNLQTVAEDLGTYGVGKVWIIVTAQESIDSLIKVKGDDFSRIQGRFDTRLSLSSISVDEVIKKRILSKKDFARDALKLLYHDESATLKNLISFKDSTAELRGYDDENEFADVYPFVPYQFKLLQKIFEQIRKHGSSGKHLSEGERSMLSAFQESAIQFKDAEKGALIPLYAFYETIREFLTPSVARVIEGAYDNRALSDDPFNVDVLKVLFMIKYIDTLPANIDNIATLMVTHINEDKLALKERIKEALRKLMSQTLIQKNGDVYIFLTDDEQDINRDIKEVKVDEDLIKRELRTYIYEDIYSEKKFKYKDDYSFSYNKKMDEKHHGNQTATIGINILSPLSDFYDLTEQELLPKTYDSGELWVKLQGSELYIEEMEEALKIEEYRKKKNISQLPENIQNILNNKQVEAKQRRRRVREFLEDAIKNAEFYVNGEKLDVKGTSVREKLNTAMTYLVENVFTKLGYVKKHFSEDDVKAVLRNSETQISFEGMKDNSNEIAKKEIIDFIKLQEELQKQVRMKTILDRFTDKPYGWLEMDIAGLTAELFKEQQIRIRYNGEYLDPQNKSTFTVLTKTSEADKAIIVKRVVVDEKLLRKARTITKEVFNKMDLPEDEDGLVKVIKELIDAKIQEIELYKAKYNGKKYPGYSLLEKGMEYFTQFTNRLDNVAFFKKLEELEENLLDWEEDFDYVERFFSNQREFFDQGLEVIKLYDDNQMYLQNTKAAASAEKLRDILSDPIPYNRIKDIPEYVEAIQSEIDAVIKEKKEQTKLDVQATYDHLVLRCKEYGVKEITKNQIVSAFDTLLKNIESYEDIYKIDASITQANALKDRFEKQIQRDIVEAQSDDNDDPEIIADPPQKQVEKVKVTDIISTRKLTSEEDVDRFVNTLASRLKKLLQQNKDIEFID
ncbi:BREX system P-loop protein BrxC [Bacillus methanolicus]|uniref:BREX system P-loop protein BrxC n=1 Tax=Bacillus methanolicus TaxID=1471 RepID=UPI000ABE194D|nr:BREX system P-loop protein BrxC [Bacillus methanolicus]